MRDGAFWLPPDPDSAGVVRPIAFVVADPRSDDGGLEERIVGALRTRVDAAFVPRRIVRVDALPREPGTGKLPALAFAAWAMSTLERGGRAAGR